MFAKSLGYPGPFLLTTLIVPAAQLVDPELFTAFSVNLWKFYQLPSMIHLSCPTCWIQSLMGN